MTRDTAWRILDIVMALVLAAIVGLTGWTLTTLVDVQQEISTIKASRFTAADGLLVYKEIADIRKDLAKMPTEVPPAWFVDRVDKFESRMDTKFSEIERRLTRIENN